MKDLKLCILNYFINISTAEKSKFCEYISEKKGERGEQWLRGNKGETRSAEMKERETRGRRKKLKGILIGKKPRKRVRDIEWMEKNWGRKKCRKFKRKRWPPKLTLLNMIKQVYTISKWRLDLDPNLIILWDPLFQQSALWTIQT